MKNSTRWLSAIAVLGALLLIGCGADLSKLPPIKISIPEPTPAAPPPAAPKPQAAIAFQILDADSGAPIATAFAKFEDGTEKQANDDGYVSFARELGFYTVSFSADEYAPVTRRFQLEGNRQFEVKLKSTKPAPVVVVPVIVPPVVVPPVVVPAPTAPVGQVAGCWAAGNTGAVSKECLEQVAATSANWPRCAAGDDPACHRYVREVARALKATQSNPRWGLIKKGGGQSCTETECGDVNGYGEDVVAYLPEGFSLDAKTWQWRGIDIVGGAGAPGARFQWGPLHEAIKCDGEPRPWCNREGDLWAPVP